MVIPDKQKSCHANKSVIKLDKNTNWAKFKQSLKMGLDLNKCKQADDKYTYFLRKLWDTINKEIGVKVVKTDGDREKMENKRGITLASTSNTEKLFERIINNRIIEEIPFTEGQAGGRKAYSTVDQLYI